MARELLDRVGGRYASCNTYQDSGSVSSYMYAEGWKSESVSLEFASRFIRPRLFRFDFGGETKDCSYLEHHVLSDGDSIRLLQSRDRKVVSSIAKHDLNETIDGLVGSSSYFVTTISNLLMPEFVVTKYPCIRLLQAPEAVCELLDESESESILKGSYRNWSMELLVDRLSDEIKRIDIDFKETEEGREGRIEHFRTLREHAPEIMEGFTFPEDAYLSTSCKLLFREQVFDDSLTVESISTFE